MDKDQQGIQVLQGFKVRKFIETSDSACNSVYFFARELDSDLKAGFDATVR